MVLPEPERRVLHNILATLQRRQPDKLWRVLKQQSSKRVAQGMWTEGMVVNLEMGA